MTGIFYYSSTGNSLYIAKRIGARLSAKVFCILNFQGEVNQFQKIIIVSPVYSFGLPKHVYDFFISLPKTTAVHVVLNYGGMLGGADYYTYQLAKTHNINIRSIYAVKMPENFTLTFSSPRFFNRIILKSAEKKINRIIDNIKNDREFLPPKKKTHETTYEKNKANWHLIAADFSVNSNCNKCRKCVRVCPAENITVKDDNIIFLDKCVACLGCYHRCPQKAIVYKNRRKKYRYMNPNISESELGKDISFNRQAR
ncbi:MAG: EFR1 family ferrodoxin [Agathobacter sp.]|nr:EFR1 family ferrodoxin [Agathobacter sp.]